MLENLNSASSLEISAFFLVLNLAIFISSVVACWALWCAGWIDIRPAGIISSVIDCALMILAMDLGMYFFHHLAHVPAIYRPVHGFHHRHETTNPIKLLVKYRLRRVDDRLPRDPSDIR
jgi:Delta7-sterol 5-desaturase